MFLIKKIISKFDQSFLSLSSKFNTNKQGIIFLLFHSVFKEKNEMEKNHIDSLWGFTIEEFKYIFDTFLEHNYTFISHNDMLNLKSLSSNKKYIYLHFDDGYFNNVNLVPVLEQFNIYANFFVVTENIINKEKFWWDFLLNKYQHKNNDYLKEIDFLKNKNFSKIKNFIIKKYGVNSLKPLSDIDRPFTKDELIDFNQNKYITIGNHTSDHSNLNSIDEKECKLKILKAEKDLENILGYSSKIFSFPNSKSSLSSQTLLNEMKFNYAISDNFKNYNLNQIEPRQYFRFGRYCFLRNKNIDWQIQMCTSKFSYTLRC